MFFKLPHKLLQIYPWDKLFTIFPRRARVRQIEIHKSIASGQNPVFFRISNLFTAQGVTPALYSSYTMKLVVKALAGRQTLCYCSHTQIRSNQYSINFQCKTDTPPNIEPNRHTYFVTVSYGWWLVIIWVRLDRRGSCSQTRSRSIHITARHSS